MSVHMLCVITSVEGDYTLDELNAAMDDWVSNQADWVDDTVGHPMADHIPEDGSDPTYRIGRYRFLLEDAKENLLQKCEDKLVNKVNFYRIGYHQCDHDEESRDGCSWDDQREWTAKDVTIPETVPVFVEGG